MRSPSIETMKAEMQAWLLVASAMACGAGAPAVSAPSKGIILNAAQPKPAAAKERTDMTKPDHARMARINGIGTLEVDGAPFLLLGAQCDVWRSTRQDDKTLAFFDGYREMNATAVSVGIPWSKIEPEEDRYDFAFLDWFIRQAETRGLRLVVNLFNTNVCGKVQEGAGSTVFPGYTPSYILSAPEKYQRMALPGPYQYDWAGPPMCPNDPRTLERERRLVVRVAEHLKSADARRTVIMLQIDNEFYYQQWAGDRPKDAKAVRCHCRFCEEKWKAGAWKSGEEFMFRSFADYVKALTDAISKVYPLPLYVNSPWWEPYVIPIFLDRCPNLALVGIDGVFAPNEPNMLSRSQLGRNIPFAAENPTENPKTRINLDVLPYYSLIGQEGIGNLLWECGPPHTVIEDPEALRKYGEALYPLKYAQVPIARARGTENLLGWYVVRDIAADVTTDIFGNFIPVKRDGAVVENDRTFVREGTRTRTISGGDFEAALGDLHIRVSGSPAGVIVRTGAKEAILAVPKGRIVITGMHDIRAEEGRFERKNWKRDGAFGIVSEDGGTVVDIRSCKVLRIVW